MFLYVFQWDTSGGMSVIFPNREYSNATNPLRAGTAYRFPTAPGWLYLDDTSGIETVGVGASARRWQEMEQIIQLLSEGDQQERNSTVDEVQKLITNAEMSSDDEYYGYRFSFRHTQDGNDDD